MIVMGGGAKKKAALFYKMPLESSFYHASVLLPSTVENRTFQFRSTSNPASKVFFASAFGCLNHKSYLSCSMCEVNRMCTSSHSLLVKPAQPVLTWKYCYAVAKQSSTGDSLVICLWENLKLQKFIAFHLSCRAC